MRQRAAIALALALVACEAGGSVPADTREDRPAPDAPPASTSDTLVAGPSPAVAPDDAIERLPLAAFPGVPDAAREALAARG
ncbi:MAG TPA: hypothetical protein VMM83_07485 [Longimicrobiales bacterium]|nr:hypothetical protein [Longimicrobiales bacterium]